jgi:hypothetical protein
LSATDFKHISGNARQAVRVRRDKIEAVIVQAPETTTDLATVAAVRGADGGALILGEASWPKPAGKELPEQGDVCLVELSETGRPWIVAWVVPNW